MAAPSTGRPFLMLTRTALQYNNFMKKSTLSGALARALFHISLVATLSALLGNSPLRAIPTSPSPAQKQAVSVRGDARPVSFRYVTEDATVKSVTIAGMFNGWNKSGNALTKSSDGKTWTVTLPLAAGVYQYKFVLNGETWVTDPTAPTVDDGNGNVNSQISVVPADYDALPGIVGDGKITLSAIKHEVTSRYIHRLDDKHVEITLRTRANDVQDCILSAFLSRHGHMRYDRVAMRRSSQDGLYDWWQADIALPPKDALSYYFDIADGANRVRWTINRVLSGNELRDGIEHHLTPFHIEAKDFPVFKTPDWVRDAVFYQIFPDRFANGDTSNDGPNVAPWGSPPNGIARQGGDLAGVIQHLDYLKALGVNALYFNPIFASRSNHGYDTNDYHIVDPRFGTNDELKTLVNALHGLGGHVILDGVFNHTSVDFAKFADLRKNGAASPYRDWYYIHSFPIEVHNGETSYVGWFNNPWLPKLNVNNPDTHAYLLDVARRWLQLGVDGWRLDAADEIQHPYWKEFRKTVKGVNPNAYIVGEIWGNASDWLQGDEFDSVMNYRFRQAVLDFFATGKSNPSQFDASLTKLRSDYPPAAEAVLFNIVDSHDTERLYNSCQGDWQRERAVVLFQFAYPGVPVIYYGDEIGLPGGHDPDDRRAFPWDKSQWNTTTLAYYQKLIALRKQHAVLRRGDFTPLFDAKTEDQTGVYGFVRRYGEEAAVALFNRAETPQTVRFDTTSVGKGGLQEWDSDGARMAKTSGGMHYIITLQPHGMALLGR